MRRPRVSIARLMLVVGVFAIDFALLGRADAESESRLFAIEPALTLGLVGALTSLGRLRRFFCNRFRLSRHRCQAAERNNAQQRAGHQ